ncbi:MAG: DUF4974 domain-containing protein [Prevotella sp.]|nr:DUF4974 domain-containing protein [Prevotella sp.]
METNDKLMTLLRLMDEPEAMTEAQLQELLSDEEVRKAYDVMADCKKVYQREKLHTPTLPSRHGQSAQRQGWIYRIAAVFLGAVLLCGLAWAIIPHIISSHTDSPQSAQVTTPLTHREGQGGGTFLRFDDVRLDSILTVVSAHYGKAVSFRDEEPRSMKLITTWDPDESLEAFIDHLNMFDYIQLTLKNDTIFVEQTSGESKE